MARLGILGGGQLAKMTALAAAKLGVEVAIFAQSVDEPALKVTPFHVIGAWDDSAKLRAFADQCDVVTLESEFVDVPVLEQIMAFGTSVWPAPATVAQIQDKLTQKRAMQQAGLEVPRFRRVSVATDVLDAAAEFGFPVVVKARRNGYDGYGNAVVNRAHDIAPALEKLAGRDLMVEANVPFIRELAVIVARTPAGEMLTYPVVETVQRSGICHVVRCPAPIDEATALAAVAMARAAVESVHGVGVFGVEMFEVAGNEVVYNEIAPRPHNTGHYTIEGVITSQFENHVRAVMGYPLGDVEQIAPATAMINILGERNGIPNPDALKEALATGGAHIHLYGKREVRIGRKMGHITVLGYSVDGAEKVARLALSRLKL
jgi:5-(carboxyamino)imidazole ribonucleotide synthase